MSAPRRQKPSDRRWLAAFVAMLCLLAACTSSTSESGMEDEATDSTGLPIPEQPISPSREAVAALSGRLAVVDGHELRVMGPDGSDDELIAGSETEVASQPSWSPDGSRLAWAQTDGIDSIVAAAVPPAEPEVSSGFSSTPFYLAWDSTGASLAYLRPEADGPRFEMGTVVPGEPPAVGQVGAPLFLSWRPDVDELALHTDGDRLELLELSSPAISIAPTTGQFTTPAWINENEVLSVEDGKLIVLDVETNAAREFLEIGDITRFVLSPDRTRLAYLTVLEGTQTIGFLPSPAQPVVPAEVRLRVFDFETGRDTLVTQEPALAFEWSPNSGLLSWLGEAGGDHVQWHIWSQAGEFNVLSPYVPSLLDRNAYLPFFDQYAQSQNRWDPDAQAVVYAGTIGAESGVWVELVDGDAGPHRISEGDYATWSPPSGGGGGASVL